MFNFKAIFYNILKFILGFTVFITIFTIANFVFYKFDQMFFFWVKEDQM